RVSSVGSCFRLRFLDEMIPSSTKQRETGPDFPRDRSPCRFRYFVMRRRRAYPRHNKPELRSRKVPGSGVDEGASLLGAMAEAVRDTPLLSAAALGDQGASSLGAMAEAVRDTPLLSAAALANQTPLPRSAPDSCPCTTS